MGHYTDRKEANEQLELLAKARAKASRAIEAIARELRLETGYTEAGECRCTEAALAHFLDHVEDGLTDMLYGPTEVWENQRDVADFAIGSLDRAEERLTARMTQ